MLTKSLGQGNDAFLSDNERFKRIVAHPNREKAKWQNRVTAIIYFRPLMMSISVRF